MTENFLDKKELVVNGRTLPYIGTAEIMRNGKTFESKGVVGGKPVKSVDYSNNFSSVKVKVYVTEEIGDFLRSVRTNEDNNVLSYGKIELTGIALKPVLIADGDEVDLEFEGNPID